MDWGPISELSLNYSRTTALSNQVLLSSALPHNKKIPKPTNVAPCCGNFDHKKEVRNLASNLLVSYQQAILVAFKDVEDAS